MDMKSFRCIKAVVVSTIFPKSRWHSKDAAHIYVPEYKP